MALAGLLTRESGGERVVPRWFAEADFPWLRTLLEACLAGVGVSQLALRARLTALELPAAAPRVRLARAVLDGLFRGPPADGAPGAALRADVFTRAAGGQPRTTVLAQVARARRLAVPQIEDSLFADLPPMRRVAAPAVVPTLPALAAEANQRLLRLLLQSTSLVVIEVESGAHAVVRLARLRGLLVVGAAEPGRSLEISGPFALFRHTRLYGRALAGLIPLLPWCGRFRLRARIELCDRALQLELSERDPLPPAAEPRAFDSQVEARFARDFQRLDSAWEVRREPVALPAGDGHLFPDFELRHRHDPRRRWLLEIVGFWTVEYLQRKLAALHAAGSVPWLLCVDRSRAVGREDLPAHARVVWFRRHVDAAAVLRAIDE